MGVDCYGLVRLVYADVLGIALPSYTEAYVGVRSARRSAAILMCKRRRQWPWAMVPPGQRARVRRGLFRRGALAAHVGVVIGAGRMLHIDERGDVVRRVL